MEHSQYSGYSKLVFLSLALLFIMPVLPSNVRSVAIGFFGIAVVANNIKTGFTFNKPLFFGNVVFFLVFAFTLIYSENTAYGIKKLIGFLPFFAFPLFFSMLKKDQIETTFYSKRNQLFYLFIISVFLLNIVPFFWYKFSIPWTWDQLYTHLPAQMTRKMGKWSINSIYTSMHLGISILFSVFVMRALKTRLQQIILGIIILVLIAFMFYYAKKGPLLALGVSGVLLGLMQSNKPLKKYFLIAAVGFIALIFLIPNTRHRFSELTHVESVQTGKPTSSNIRYTIYKTSLSVIKKAPLIGYGIGDFNDVLYQAYTDGELKSLIKGKYNAHNQYLSFLIMGGITLLCAFLWIMGVIFIKAIRHNNKALIVVMVFYGIAMLFESILEREHGIIFFCLFIFFLSLFNFPKRVIN